MKISIIVLLVTMCVFLRQQEIEAKRITSYQDIQEDPGRCVRVYCHSHLRCCPGLECRKQATLLKRLPFIEVCKPKK